MRAAALPANLLAADKIAASDLLNRAQAAQYLGVAVQTLAVWASTGRYGLKYIRVGRNVRYRRADLDAFLASRTVTSTGELSR